MRNSKAHPAPDFRSLFESAPEPYLVLTPDLNIVAVSEAYLRATMTRREEIIGRGIFDVFPDNPDDPTATGVRNLRASLERVLRNKVPDTMAVQKYDIRKPEAEGGGFEERHWSPVNSPVLDSHQRVAYIIHRVEDVTEFVRLKNQEIEQSKLTKELQSRADRMEAETFLRAKEVQEANRRLEAANRKLADDIIERKQAEEALQAREEQLRSIVETANDAIISANREGKIIHFNSAAERTFGYSAAEVIGGPLSILMPECFHAAHRAGFARYLSTGEAHVIGKQVELAGRRKDGTEFPLALSLAEWKTKEGVFFTGVLSDITERKRAEAALLQAKEQAERGSKFKDQFLSTMSHELRTPLNAVLGFSELLTDDRYGPLNEKQRRYVSHIRSGGQHLLSLINDILDLSKIEAGRLELAMEEVPVAALFMEVVSALRPLAEHKSQQLVHSSSENWAVRADALRLKQILMNLVGNAIKFIPEGGRIELSAQPSDAGIRLEVRDNGPGIPAEEQKRIFEAFYRLRNAGKALEGTGLGLAITQRLVELHGGQLQLVSAPGTGCCFHFYLPALARAGVEQQQKAPHGPRKPGAQTILVIEDDPLAANLIGAQLSSAGYEPVLCDLPRSALELAATLQPMAITLDLLMSPVNGWELLLQLKHDKRTKEIPVIVVSIVDQPGMGITLGADEYLIKPVEQETLLAAVERCVGPRRENQLRPILVVEDNSAAREMTAELLRSRGYAVTTAADGAQARAAMAASIPELVVLDLILPHVSGFELLAEWRAAPRTAEVPVFILTGKDLTPVEQMTLRSQAELLLSKQQPWQESLLKQLRRTLPQSSGESA